ncbi:hypothetical protein FQN57_003440 [Myotisia sp. PD_48]|nr:hypothetical protein FQN57_003440 [Myotisia sp. PD_48]
MASDQHRVLADIREAIVAREAMLLAIEQEQISVEIELEIQQAQLLVARRAAAVQCNGDIRGLPTALCQSLGEIQNKIALLQQQLEDLYEERRRTEHVIALLYDYTPPDDERGDEPEDDAINGTAKPEGDS